MNPDAPSQWAAADDIVDTFVRTLRAQPMPTSQLAMNLLAIDHPQRLILMAMIAATALQQLASQ